MGEAEQGLKGVLAISEELGLQHMFRKTYCLV